jgi:hypothetical protein
MTMLDGPQFRDDCERITNGALISEWLGMYRADAVAEWATDGAYDRYEGIDAITVAVRVQERIWREQGLRVKKTLECADDDSVVLSWTGGFGGRSNQFGVEIWTLEDGLVVRHQMYLYLDLRPRRSAWAQIRVFLASPRIAMSLGRNERAVRRSARAAGARPASPAPSRSPARSG